MLKCCRFSKRFMDPTQNKSRRSFLKASALAGTACIIGSPALAGSLRTSVIVIGAGAFGGWSALQNTTKMTSATRTFLSNNRALGCNF